MNKYIQNFKVYFSESQLSQERGIDWLANYQGVKDKAFFERYAVSPDYIHSRHVYAKGIRDTLFTGEALYSVDEKSNPSMDMRAEHAQEKVEEIFQQLYKDENEIPNQLNHVSCTHYQSPSAAQKLVVAKEWFSSTPVTHLYHMGCYAALPAVRVSKAYVADGSNQVDVVHTELCSFHLDKENVTPEQIIMDTLFADGAIKYSVTSEDYFQSKKKSGFEIITQKEVVVPGSEEEMSWKVGSHGFVMTLTRKVPMMLAKKIETFMRDLFIDANLDFDKDKDDVVFAIHPGGPKIIELVERVLKLENDQVKHSKAILASRGNMSSATIPHIWNEILEDKDINSNTHIATVAFGPGLTITGAILKLCRQ
jgi:predicted naringenin-chalcone synthase